MTLRPLSRAARTAARLTAAVALICGVLGVAAPSAHAASSCSYYYTVNDSRPTVSPNIGVGPVTTYFVGASAHTVGCAAFTIEVVAVPQVGTPHACQPIPQIPLDDSTVCFGLGGEPAVALVGTPTLVIATFTGVDLSGNEFHETRTCTVAMPRSPTNAYC